MLPTPSSLPQHLHKTNHIERHKDSNLCKLQKQLSVFFLLNVIVIEIIQYWSSNCLMQKLCKTITNASMFSILVDLTIQKEERYARIYKPEE
jgi:hypothetical protein